MYPVLLTYSDHTLTTWILFALIGAWAAYFSLSADLRLRKIKPEQVNAFFIGCVIIWFLGAHWGQTVTVGNSSEQVDLTNRFSGLVLYAGVSAVLFFSLVVWLLGWKKKLLLEEFWDCGALAFAWALGFGRIGCTLYGCCYGTPSGSWPGYQLNERHWDYLHLNFPKELTGVKLHPATLYEALALFVLVGVLYALRHHEKKRPGRFPPGVMGWICWWSYGLARLLTEFIRLDPRGNSYFGFSPSQWFSLLMIGLGTVLIPFYWRRAAVPIYRRSTRR